MNLDNKFQKISELKAELDKLSSRKRWNQDFLEQLKIDFTHVSNKIEGNKLEYGQTIRLLRELVVPKYAPPGDMLDIIHHKEVLDIVFRNFNGLSISEESIKNLHKALMRDRFQWSDDGLFSPGQYKSFDNVTYRQNGKEHKYLTAEQVPAEMSLLIHDINSKLQQFNLSDRQLHPLTIATFFHQRFLNVIHPFSDGNGRIGRIVMNLILMKCDFPPIFIDEVDRELYFKTFELSESDPDAMLDFMADRLIESLQRELKQMSDFNAG